MSMIASFCIKYFYLKYKQFHVKKYNIHMKTKKIKKIISKSIKEYEIHNSNLKNECYDAVPTDGTFNNNIMFTPMPKDDRVKVKNLIIRLLSNRNNIHFSHSDRVISISGKNNDYVPHKISTKNVITQKEFYYRIEIMKDIGIIIESENKKTCFSDKTIFDEIESKANDCFTEVNKNNFTELYASIMMQHNLNRESNLDDILNDSI